MYNVEDNVNSHWNNCCTCWNYNEFTVLKHFVRFDILASTFVNCIAFLCLYTALLWGAVFMSLQMLRSLPDLHVFSCALLLKCYGRNQ